MGIELYELLVKEFSDLDLLEFVRVAVRLTVAAVLGGILGFEREQHGKSAGIRTHMLISMGAAMFVMIPQLGGLEDAELSRVLQGVIAGVGFLGAGTIVKNQGEDVRGLTTAAGIWLTAAIGVSAGLGRELTAIISTVFAMIILSLVPHLPFVAQDKLRKSNYPSSTHRES
ncbi:MAG: MgtC/SapB family protein [Pirellula sp.]|nr:MgtC/SapB family protein [Pirellula sp.]